MSYQRWLVAKGNVLSPGPAAIAKLVERLRKEKWLPPEGGTAVKTVDAGQNGTEKQPTPLTSDWLAAPDREEQRLIWEIPGGGALKYPLNQAPDGGAAWTFEIHRAAEFVYPTADNIEPIDTECNCEEDLSFEWDEEEVSPAFKASSGIFHECEECSRVFDPAQHLATITNPFDDSEEEFRGGAAYRFAVKVDCPKYVKEASLAFAPDLVALLEDEFGRTFYQFATITR